MPTLLISPWITAGTVFRSTKAIKYDHTSLIATILTWCGVDPTTAGLGDRVAAAPMFDGVLADRPRTDVPRFTLPDGYAQQGAACWIASQAEQREVGLMRNLTARSTSFEDLQAKIEAAAEPS